ncbi:TrmH family RNA methyltransferase [[Clostridium] colinum]|uniref:TrmH family RNA methyltransferase n=1 Tax=[Clostridium] colinum TaxID=36835 RepID=UPI002023EAA6|nr:RNA methyltransferase [[Clostridium] colinum]
MITSEKNKIIKDIIKLKQKKEREKTGKFYIEGERIIDEIPSNIKIESYIFSEKFYNQILNMEKYKNSENIVVSDNIFKKISDTINPQGIMAICHIPKNDLKNIKIKDNSFFVILDRICDPGNMGTIVRTAEALGVDAIFLSKGCVNLYNDKVIRATMGSIFHIPIIENENVSILIEYLQNNNVDIVCTYLEGGEAPYNIDFKKSVAILIGNEANGVLEEYKNKANKLIKIPMVGNVESMNASISSAIIFYEVLSQRLKE